jgi:hypothetical protein
VLLLDLSGLATGRRQRRTPFPDFCMYIHTSGICRSASGGGDLVGYTAARLTLRNHHSTQPAGHHSYMRVWGFAVGCDGDKARRHDAFVFVFSFPGRSIVFIMHTTLLEKITGGQRRSLQALLTPYRGSVSPRVHFILAIHTLPEHFLLPVE